MSQSVLEKLDFIHLSARHILDTVPPNVTVVAAAKGRTPAEVEAVIQAGITHIGHNYVQEAQPMIEAIGDSATWHMIGHLQRNKAKRVALLFDMIETLDSLRLAKVIDRLAMTLGKEIPVLVEVNSGRESNKTGVFPEDIIEFVDSLGSLKHINIQGLMTMGPRFGDPENARPYFHATRHAFERLRNLTMPNMDMHYLSMGMSNSYMIAIEEGANIVRIGTRIFGSRSD
jgi:pyridoxal phosphate enzyme (YggS family)